MKYTFQLNVLWRTVALWEDIVFSEYPAILQTVLLVALVSVALPGQQSPVPQHCTGCELPVVLRENVVAGKTPVGAKVDAKLVVATMVKGGVIPRDALISGEVIESTAKKDGQPSRLAIRMDSAQWKDGSARFKIYLTAWYYPALPLAAPDLSYRPVDAQNSNKNPGGTDYTDPKNVMSQQKWPPQHDSDNGMTAAAPASSVSHDRVVMKNVESARTKDGAVELVSDHGNIKLDKLTTYVLAADELMPGK